MSEKTKNLTELLDLILDGISIVVDAEADGKITLEDAGLLLRLVPSLGPAIGDIGMIPAELSAMTTEDSTELATHVMAKLAVTDEHARKVIDASLKTVVAIHGLIGAIKS